MEQKKKETFLEKFILFIRTQGVIGLAVAVVLGGAVQRVVTALVNDVITPLLNMIIGKQADLRTATVTINGAVFAWGDFLSTIIDFLIIAFVIYLLVKVIHVDAIDKPKPQQ